MKTKTWTRAALAAAMLALATSVAGPSPVSAQDVRAECRCVDADGNEIENCTCFRGPRMNAYAPLLALQAGQPRLGVTVSADQSARIDADGAEVTDVLEGGPADEAGIREGDVITRIGAQSLTEPTESSAERLFDLDRSIPVQRLLAIVAELEPGQEVEVAFLRDGTPQTTVLETRALPAVGRGDFSVALPRFRDGRDGEDRLRELLGGEWRDGVAPRVWSDEMVPGGDLPGNIRLRFNGPHDGGVAVFDRGRGLLYSSERDGLSLIELKPALGAYFGATEGVLVTDVTRRSGLGLEAGDVVLAIGDRTVTNPDRFRRILSSYGDEEDITFRILRDGSETSVTGRLRY